MEKNKVIRKSLGIWFIMTVVLLRIKSIFLGNSDYSIWIFLIRDCVLLFILALGIYYLIDKEK